MRCTDLLFPSFLFGCCSKKMTIEEHCKEADKLSAADIDKLSAKVIRRENGTYCFIHYKYSKEGYGRLDYAINYIKTFAARIWNGNNFTSYVYGADVAKIKLSGSSSTKISNVYTGKILSAFHEMLRNNENRNQT